MNRKLKSIVKNLDIDGLKKLINEDSGSGQDTYIMPQFDKVIELEDKTDNWRKILDNIKFRDPE